MEQQGETRMCGLTGQGENRIEEEERDGKRQSAS